jgi:Rrf2 family protein
MFRINRKTDYAIRIMVCLARRPFGARLPTQEIQTEMLIPRAFLQRIIADLSKNELIRTFPGPNGGLELARPAESINLKHIWEAVEGPLLISDCLQTPGECPLDADCPVQRRWCRLQALLVHELEATSLQQLGLEANQVISVGELRRVVDSMKLSVE